MTLNELLNQKAAEREISVNDLKIQLYKAMFPKVTAPNKIMKWKRFIKNGDLRIHEIRVFCEMLNITATDYLNLKF